MKMADDPERHRAGLGKWLSGDPERIAVYNRVAKAMRIATWSAVRLDLPREKLSLSQRAISLRPRRAFAMAAAAAFIVAGSVAYLGFFSLDRTDERVASHLAKEDQSYSTRTDEVRRIRLPDGSSVTLDTASALAIHFTAAQRTIKLHRGRARFEVTHDALRPFVVLAGGGSITATGTVFDVDVRRTVRVHLISGSVEVALPVPPSAAARAPIKLSHGQFLAFGSGISQTVPTPQPAHTPDSQWMAGMMSFEDVPLADVVAEANRYAKVRIIIADPQLLTEEMFVELDIRDTEQVARKLAVLLDLEVDRSRPGELILRSRR